MLGTGSGYRPRVTASALLGAVPALQYGGC